MNNIKNFFKNIWYITRNLKSIKATIAYNDEWIKGRVKRERDETNKSIDSSIFSSKQYSEAGDEELSLRIHERQRELATQLRKEIEKNREELEKLVLSENEKTINNLHKSYGCPC